MTQSQPKASSLAGVYWAEQDDLAALPVGCELAADRGPYDVAIIGAGYTGLNAAIELAGSGSRVAVFDAGVPGSGASGRNAGHVAPLLGKRGPRDLVRRLGTGAGERAARWIAGGPDVLFERIARYAMDCEVRRSGHLSLVRSARKLDKLRALPEEWASYGAPLAPFGQDRAASLAPNGVAAGGWIQTSGGSLNPYRYAHELARVALDQGARVFANNPVISAGRAAGFWTLQTPTGTLRARCLIVATNATRPDTAFSLRERGMPIACAMLASEPLDPQAYVDFPGPWTWADDPLLFSGLVDHRNRLTTSVLVGRDARSAETIGASADRSFERYFPAASLPVWSHCWQGDILATSDGLPRLVQLDEECFAAFGCNGFGIALGTLLGIELAKLARGSGEALELPLGRAPRSIANRLMPSFLENLLVPLARRAG